MAAGNLCEDVHLGGNPEGVNDKEGTGAGRDGALDGCRVEVEGDGVNLRKDRGGADLENGVGHGDEGE